MDYKANVFTSLCQDVEDVATAVPVVFIVQDMLWDGLREEAVICDNRKKYSRVVNDEGEAISKWTEVKNQEVK